MSAERFARVRAIVLAAAELTPAARAAYLDEACGDDEALRAEAVALLAHDREAPSLVRTAGLGRRLAARRVTRFSRRPPPRIPSRSGRTASSRSWARAAWAWSTAPSRSSRSAARSR